jgi:diguanylate cyclase (GGDEF)-like protein/putative nucleotidyltransferase with HDIG domain
MTFKSLPAPLRAYILITMLAGGAALGTAAQTVTSVNPLLLVCLLISSVIFSTWRVQLTIHGSVMTLTSAVVCLAMLLPGGGPFVAVLCAGLGAVVGTIARLSPGHWLPSWEWRVPWYKTAFNAAVCVAAAGIAGWFYQGATSLVASANGADRASIPALVAGITAFQAVYFLLNTLGVSVALALLNGQKLFNLWRDNFFWTWPSYFVSASVAVGISAAFKHPLIGMWALLLLPPLYFIYYSYRLYLDRMNLYVSKVEQDMRHIQELNELNSAIIASLATAIDAKDRYTRSHINRVQMYAVALAESVGLSGPDLEAVRTGALIHDIGKLGIPERILGKPGKLTPDEFRRMQAHVTIGAEILAPVKFPYPVLPIVLTHHERWDGLGYPQGLKGEEIPIGGRIMSISDVFDALTSNRPYRRAMSPEEALATIREGAGKQFDPNLVEHFARILPEVRKRVEEMDRNFLGETSGESASATDSEPNWAFTQISQSAAEMSATCELAQGLAETTTVAEVVDVVLDRALRLLPADTAVFYLCGEDGGMLTAAGVKGMYEEKLSGLQIGRGEGVSGWVAETLQAQVNAQASLDIGRRFNPNEVMELSAAAAVPLVQGSSTLGVLTLYTTGYSVLNEHHLGVLKILAEHAASAVLSARRYEQTRELSLTDPLTGLPNSRSLIHHVETLCNGSGNGERQPFSILMFDLDRFKEVNDTLGHLRGDAVLQEFGEILRGLCSERDLPCRYAGDEFVVVLSGSTPADADAYAVAVRKELAERSRNWLRRPVEVSVGAGSFPEDGEDVRSLLAVADQRMYNDKFSRRAPVRR